MAVIGFEKTGAVAVDAGVTQTCVVTVSSRVMCWGFNLVGEVGDGTVNLRGAPVDIYIDIDHDGCIDIRELDADPAFGGLRNPKYFWDFFDTPDANNVRDRIISTGDIFRIVLRFGSTGDPAVDPLSPPLPSGYHPAFDRSPPVPGGDPWDIGSPDGVIATNDLLFSVNQFGHTCA